jgi:hypothetical protein
VVEEALDWKARMIIIIPQLCHLVSFSLELGKVTSPLQLLGPSSVTQGCDAGLSCIVRILPAYWLGQLCRWEPRLLKIQANG